MPQAMSRLCFCHRQMARQFVRHVESHARDASTICVGSRKRCQFERIRNRSTLTNQWEAQSW